MADQLRDISTATDELAALLECPVCFNRIHPPIMQCQAGHLVCASCRPNLTVCPTCRGTLGNIRNLALEKVANDLMFACRHKATGCTMLLRLNEKKRHEEICEFRPYSCPYPGTFCSWQGHLANVILHLQDSHENITILNGNEVVFWATKINAGVNTRMNWVMLQSCFGHHFMLVLKKQKRNEGDIQLFAFVQLIGIRKREKPFVYSLDLIGFQRRLFWEAMVQSSNDVDAADCLILGSYIAHRFSGNTDDLPIKVTIS